MNKKQWRRAGGTGKRPLNRTRRLIAARSRKKGKAGLIPKALGTTLARRVAHRREALGLTRLADHFTCLGRNFRSIAMMHGAREEGYRQGHLDGYDSGYTSGLNFEPPPEEQDEPDRTTREMPAEELAALVAAIAEPPAEPIGGR